MDTDQHGLKWIRMTRGNTTLRIQSDWIPDFIRVNLRPSVVQKQQSGASAQNLDAPYRTFHRFVIRHWGIL
jgi:hypothetical protein